MRAKIITDDTVFAIVVAVQILISSYLFKFSRIAQKFATMINRALRHFDFDRAITLRCVARCPSIRFHKRYRCFFVRAVVNRLQRVSIPDAC